MSGGDESAETPAAEPPVTRDGEIRAAFAAGQTSGRMEQKLDQVLEKQARIEAQNGRLEAQNVQILEQHNDFAAEVAKVANEYVELRQRITNLEAGPAATHHVTAIGATATSVHDSLRAVAMKQEQLDKKQDDQTRLLQRIDGQKILFWLGIILAGVISGWVQSRAAAPQAAPPPTYLTAPMPAPAFPRSIPTPSP